MGKGRRPRQVVSVVMNAHLETGSWEPAAGSSDDNHWATTSTADVPWDTYASAATSSASAWDAPAPKPRQSTNSNKAGPKDTVQAPAKSSSATASSDSTKSPAEPSLAAKSRVNCLLGICPDEVMEKILVHLSMVDINNLLAAVSGKDKRWKGGCPVTYDVISRNVYNPEGKDEERYYQTIALIAQDNDLYKRGYLRAISDSLSTNLIQACTGPVSSIIISGSTCLMASQLLPLVASTITPKGVKMNRKCPLLKNIEIHNSQTFSPLALLHHATQGNLTFSQITFTMTGMQMRWGIHFPYGHGTQLAAAFLYAYGAKLWRHFPTAFSRYNAFGQWLNVNTRGVFLDQSAWKLIQHSSATRYVPSDEYYGDDYLEDEFMFPNDVAGVPGWTEMGPAQKRFAFEIARPIFNRIDLSFEGNPERVGRDRLCHSCNQRLPEFCWQVPQLKKDESEGICILCAYDRYEYGQDETHLRPYQSNTRHPRPELLPQYWKHETLGCRPSVFPRKLMEFKQDGGNVIEQDEGKVIEKDGQENEFCTECDEQLDIKEMKAGLCRSCQKGKAKKPMSFREERNAKREKAAKLAAREDRSPPVIPAFYQESENLEDISEVQNTELPATAVVVVAESQSVTEDRASTTIEEKYVVVEEETEFKHSELPATVVAVIEDHVATESLASNSMGGEDVAIGEPRADGSQTEVGITCEDKVASDATETQTSPEESSSGDNDDMPTLNNVSRPGNISTTTFSGSLTLGDDEYQEFLALYIQSENLSRAGVKLCILCSDRLQENEIGKCIVCTTLRNCPCCGDGVDGLGSTWLCTRCETCEGDCESDEH